MSNCFESLIVLRVLLLFILVHVDAACPIPNCSQCNGNSGCNMCEDGYWLDDGTCNKCSTNCLTCYHSSQCESCLASYWNPIQSCVVKCSVNCTDSGCDDITGECYGCKHGTYGPTCEQDCTLCVNNECDQRKCTHGCKDGYFKYGTDSGICLPCSVNCIKCSNGTYCTHCEEGFYGSYYRIIINGRGTMLCYTCDDVCTQCTSIDQCQHCQPECIKLQCEISGTCTTTSTTLHASEPSTIKSTQSTTTPTTKPVCSNECKKVCDIHGTLPYTTTCPSISDLSTQTEMDAIYYEGFGHGVGTGVGILVLVVIMIAFVVFVIRRKNSLRTTCFTMTTNDAREGHVYENTTEETGIKPVTNVSPGNDDINRQVDVQMTTSEQETDPNHEYTSIGDRQHEHHYSDLLKTGVNN